MTATEASGMLMAAIHVYIPPKEVRSGLNVRLLVVTLPSVTACPTMMASLLSNSSAPFIHTTSGEENRFPALVTLQINVCWDPAVEDPSRVISTCGAGRSAHKIKRKS